MKNDIGSEPFPSRIIILSLQGLGNNVFLVPMLHALHKNHPGIKIDMLVFNKSIKSIFDLPGLVDNWFFLGTPRLVNACKALSVVMALRRKKYPLSILAFPSNNIFFNLISFLIAAKTRITHEYPRHNAKLGFLNTQTIPIEKCHDIYQNLHLAGVREWDVDGQPRIHYRIENSDKKRLEEKYRLRESCFRIGIHPGSSSERAMKEKRWPSENFNALMDWILARKQKSRIYVFLGPDEMELREKINITDPRVQLVEEKDLSCMIHLISKMDYYIANDSGLMNMAVALHVPTLNIAGGPTDPIRTYPLGKGHVILFSTIHCYPCRGLDNLGQKFRCPYPTRKCLEQITLEQVKGVLAAVWG